MFRVTKNILDTITYKGKLLKFLKKHKTICFKEAEAQQTKLLPIMKTTNNKEKKQLLFIDAKKSPQKGLKYFIWVSNQDNYIKI